MKKFIYFGLFSLITPLTLSVSFFTLGGLSQLKNPSISQAYPNVLSANDISPGIYAALPKQVGFVDGQIITADARPVIIQKYLERYHSPMAPHYLDLFLAAEKYQVNPWLIIAIAQCESNLCKKYPAGSYNCWGFENGDTRFLSWRQAFDQVAKTLKEGYLDLGLDTPEKIMPKYAPPSVEKGGPWAKCVSKFIDQIDRGEF